MINYQSFKIINILSIQFIKNPNLCLNCRTKKHNMYIIKNLSCTYTDILKCFICIIFTIFCALINQFLMFISAHKIIIEYNFTHTMPDYVLDNFQPIHSAYRVFFIKII